MAEQGTPAYYTTMAVAKLFENESMRLEFMNIYSQSTAAAQKYLEDNLDIPGPMAEAIVTKKDKELSDFVGANVCTYLW